ncbi:MAG: hypothetical protein AAF611_06660 [Bacteroidota bacterium]
MKRHLFFIACCMTLMLYGQTNSIAVTSIGIHNLATENSESNKMNYTAIPDANFEAALVALGIDTVPNDGQVLTADIQGVTSLNLDNQNIDDLTGIEDFIALTNLNCRRNNLTTLNVSQNVLLESLNAAQNNLTTVDISNNLSLDTLTLFFNDLTSIDVSNNTALEILNIYSNDNLTSLDIITNTLLKEVYVFNTGITSLDVSNNTDLRELRAYNTPLATIDVSNNTLLEELRVDNTNVTVLDVTNNSNLVTLRVDNTSIQTLDLSNQTSLVNLYANDTSLNSLNIQNGNNTNVNTFNVTNNPNLMCITVDDAAYSTTNWTNIDAGMFFSTGDCRYTQIPDADFETELEALGIDDITNDGQIPTAQIEIVTVLDITDEGVADLTGIEDFIALEELKANGNNITSLDISNSPALKVLWLTGGTNNLSTLDLSNNPLVEDLKIQYSGTSIDIANNTALEEFECTNCGLTSLNTSTNTNLRRLELDDTPIALLDLSTNAELRALGVDNTNLVALDLSNNSLFNDLSANNIATLTTLNVQNGNNTAINTATFQVTGNPLVTCITVDDVSYSTTNWTNIDVGMFFSTGECRYTQIPDANFEAALETLGYDDISGDGQVPTAAIEVVTNLNINNQGISDLTGIEDFSALRQLNVNGNSLTSLNISNNTVLRVLEATGNVFNTLDLSANVALEEIKLSNFSGTSIDIANNTTLVNFECTDCNLSTLDTSANTGLEELDLAGSSVTSLDLSNNVVLLILQIENTDITSLDLSNNVALLILIANNISTLTSLNIQNGTNTSILGFETTGTPVPCILVDDVAYSTANWTFIDTISRFSDTNCNYTAIPDANFEAELVALGYDNVSGDGQVLTSLIETVTTLDVSSKNISDLTGIEDFTALVTLNCEANTLTALDISSNTALETLLAQNNQIAALDISQNTSLKNIDVGNNPIPSLNLSNNSQITKLECNGTNITTLDITNLTQLDFIEAHNTSISTLDLSQNTILRFANLLNTNLSTLDVSANIGLTTLWLNNTPLTTLDLTTNTLLQSLRTWETNITELDLTNQTALQAFWGQNGALEKLNIRSGTNTSLNTFDVRNNPNLTCVLVDDVAYSTTNWTLVDATTSFSSTYCDYTAIPDANFEAALNTLGYDDTAADGQVPTELIEGVTSLDVSNQNIADLTGIEDFAALIDLNVDTNTLTSLDVSNNTDLQTLNFDNNTIATLNLGTISGLTSIEGRYNQLTTLDLSNNPNLTFINLRNNLLSSINISNNPLLETITIRGNASLTSLDLSNKPNLRSLFLQDSGLTALDVSQNPLLEKIVIERVNFNAIDVSNLPNLFELRIADNNFTALDVSNNPVLVRLECENNDLTYLNIKNGNNTHMPNADFIATGNPNLTCILVDDAVWSATNWTNIDVTASFSDIYCRYTAIPDANFEAELEALGYDDISGDGQVPTALIEGITSLAVPNKGINDLTGIEDFVALTSLNCRLNNLIALDVSQNVLLSTLTADTNSIAAIDLSNNTNLAILNLAGSNLTSLDISNNTLLRQLYINGNGGLTSLNISNNTELVAIRTYSTNIASLDVSVHPDLESLQSQGSPLASIDLSNNPLLETLRLENTNITALDVTNNPNITSLRVNDTSIETLDLSNQTALQTLYANDTSLRSLNVQNGNNTNVTTFRAEDNPNLSCILVDDVAYSTTNWTNIDAGLVFSNTYCEYTAIPDANFEARLEALGYDDISGDGQVPTPLIEVVTTLDINSQGIADMTGIEGFIALEELSAALNTFTSLDLSNNTALRILTTKFTPIATLNITANTQLEQLVCSFNDLSSLDISANTVLTYLECNNNSIGSLDVSTNTALLDVRCGNNALTSIDLTNNTLLTTFWCDNNMITSLDLSLQTALTSFLANDNDLNSLNLKNGNNTNVTNFLATNNPNLNCIVVDDEVYSTANWTGIDATAYFTDVDCRYTAIPDTNFEAALESSGFDDISGDGQVPTRLIEGLLLLTVDNQGITDLTGIEDFTALQQLRIRNNNITTLDVSANLDLRLLYAGGNDLSTLDISANTMLRQLQCQSNRNLNSLVLGNNTNLDNVRADNTNISTLDVAANTGLTTLRIHDTALISLDLSTLTSLTNLRCYDTNISFLNMQNGNNTNVTFFDITNNANLSCVLVDDVAYSTTNWTDIDAGLVFSDTYCRYTNIPDANFEARLEALGYDDISGDGQVPTALIEVVTNLDIRNEGITDVTGMEDFSALITLDVSDNTIGTIDISNSTNLTLLEANTCGLTSLDISQNPALFSVSAHSNQLTSLNTTNNTGLESITLYGNLLTAVDFTTNTALDYVDVFQNQLTALDLRTNTDVEVLFCDNNNITNLDLSLNSKLETISCSGNELISLNVQNGNNIAITSFDALNNDDLYCILVDDEAYSTTNWTNKDAQANFNETSCDFVIVDVDVFLQGALINPNSGEETLMRDDLRIAGAVYDGTSPYGDDAIITMDVGIGDNGVNSMVDWIWVELRDAGSPTTVIAGQSAVLQRDGDIVDTSDDANPLTFDNVPAGDYYIVVKHRNHLGIMSASAISLKQVSSTIDFTDATNEITYGSNAQTTFGMPTNVVAMWAGNVNGDTVVQYSGVSPDTPDILSTVLNDAGNFLNFPTYVVSGYNTDDVNLDGNTQYSGTDPDTPFILQNVLAHPGNFLNFSTYQIVEQLPENE